MKQPIKDYNSLLNDLKSILQNGLNKAYKAVDNHRVQTYWQLGERIVREEIKQKRADYGKKIINNLAPDLNFSRDELYRILQFYKVYPIVVTLSRQLSWSHYVELIKVKNKKSRQFYETQTIKENWSVRVLRNKIKSNEYEKFRKTGQIITKLPQRLPKPEEIFKESYNWNFLSLEDKHSESDLEDALLNNIQKILLELGSGFAFVDRQQKILINNQWHKIDLLFYHISLKCYIIVELKARELKQGDIEQVTKYLTFYRENNTGNDNEPIALIICKNHDKIDVYYSAGKNKDDIFVAKYKTRLPAEKIIKSKLIKDN